MKKTAFSIALVLTVCLWSCAKKEMQTELSSNNLAGYLDTHSGILFTTAADQSDVLTKLQAKPEGDGLYAMPIMTHEGKTVLYIFQVTEVENPSEYQAFIPVDICMDEVFFDFEKQIVSLIDQKVPNLKDRILMACGGLLGDLEEKVLKDIPKAERKKELEKLDVFRKKMLENGQEKGAAAEEALKQEDLEAAKKEGGALNEKAREDYYLDLDYCRDKLWNFGLGVRLRYELNEEIPPEVINEFERDFIRYKVYKDASCQDGPATMARICTQELPLLLGRDSLNRPIRMPLRWVSDEYFARKVCRIGSGFCVEQEVVIGAGKVYSDAGCTRLINIRQYKGFGCFDS